MAAYADGHVVHLSESLHGMAERLPRSLPALGLQDKAQRRLLILTKKVVTRQRLRCDEADRVWHVVLQNRYFVHFRKSWERQEFRPLSAEAVLHGLEGTAVHPPQQIS